MVRESLSREETFELPVPTCQNDARHAKTSEKGVLGRGNQPHAKMLR